MTAFQTQDLLESLLKVNMYDYTPLQDIIKTLRDDNRVYLNKLSHLIDLRGYAHKDPWHTEDRYGHIEEVKKFSESDVIVKFRYDSGGFDIYHLSKLSIL